MLIMLQVNASSWLSVYPQGLKYVLIDMKKNYKNPPIYITENGIKKNLFFYISGKRVITITNYPYLLV